MVHMVLLGPLLDHRVLNFAFGNRWYRPIAWDRRQKHAQWVLRPYPLLTNRIYLPYARSHGLFRRVAHWTVARMTGASVDREDYGGRVQHPEDYCSESLPPWINGHWWEPRHGADRRACWAALDIQLAYPSVCLDQLRKSLIEMLHLDVESPEELLGGYPSSILEVLACREARQHIGTRLMDALENICVNHGAIPRSAWRPFHASPVLPPEKDEGIPTGLAISGMLLNVAFYSVDRAILDYLNLRDGNQRGAIVRFADDMYVLSRSTRGLLDLIEEVWCGLAGDNGTQLAVPKSKSNLYLNFTKLGPPAVRDVVNMFLCKQGWEKCKDCEQLLPPRESRTPQTLGDWWADNEANEDFDRLRDAVERSAVGPKEVGPFVTALLARLSEIGMDTLTERFGEGARDRLVRLHELARFDIVDEQIRADTRRTFAVNRLVRAWLPPDMARTALSDIRISIAYVLHATPWKFALWRAVVRAAARRPIGQEHNDHKKKQDCEAKGWLSDQLQRIAYSPGTRDTLNPRSWMHTWPEECANEKHHRDGSWQALYLSFHRTAFWHALADVLGEPWRHHDRIKHPHAGDSGPSPRWWTVRAVPEGRHDHVAKFFGALDQWVDVLYPQNVSVPDLTTLPWELDQLVAAVLASRPRGELADAWRRAERPGDVLMIPATLRCLQMPRTVEILKRFGRIQPRYGRARFLNTSALAHVQLGGRDHRLGDLLFPPDQLPRILGTNQDPMHTVAIGVSLGCSESVGRDLAAEAGPIPKPREGEGPFQKDPLALWEYGRTRRILLGHGKEQP